MRMKILTHVVVTLVALALFAAPALANKRRVVVLGFSGPAKQAKRAEKTVTKVLRHKYEVVSVKKYVKARKRLRAKKPTKKNFSKIARTVGIDAIVSGEVRRRGSRYTLKLTVREGLSGKVLDTVRIPIRGKRLAASAVEDDLYDLVAWAEPIGEDWERGLPPPEKRRKRVAKKRKKKKVEPDPEPYYYDDDDDEIVWDEPDEPVEDDVITDDELTTSVEVAARETGAKAYLHAGMSFIGRDLTFTHQASLTPEQQPTSYDGGIVGGVYLQGEIYPTRFMKKPPSSKRLDNVAVSFELDSAVGLRSEYSDDTMDYDFDTSQRRWGIGLSYTVDLGQPVVKVGAGYNQLRHTIDNGTVDIGLPNVNYKYIDLGATLQYRINDKLVALGGAKYLAVFGAGEIVTAGAYGAATVKGLDIDAGVEYAVTPRFGIKGGLRYLRMAFDFDGNGDMSTNLDGDPDQDVGGAADKYVGGYILGGYEF